MMEESRAREKLIEAGKKEFLTSGYQKASLRSICASAGISTGSIYFFFGSKADFFDCIVSDTAQRMMEMMQQMTYSEWNGDKTGVENDRMFVRFLFEHKEETLLLLEQSKNTPYEGFKDEICKLSECAFAAFYKKYGGDDPYQDIVKILVQMRIQGYLSLLHGDYDMETAMDLSEMLSVYSDCGFMGMMKKWQSVKEGSAG